jgi:hypothetical protein
MKRNLSLVFLALSAQIYLSCSENIPTKSESDNLIKDLPKVINVDFNLKNNYIPQDTNQRVEIEFIVQFDSARVKFPIEKIIVTDGKNKYTEERFGTSNNSARWIDKNSIVFDYRPDSTNSDSIKLGHYSVTIITREFNLENIPIKVWARNDTSVIGGYAYSQRTGKNPVPLKSPIIDSVRYTSSGLLLDSVKVYFTNTDTLVGRGISIRLAEGNQEMVVLYNTEYVYGFYPRGSHVVSFKHTYSSHRNYYLSMFSKVLGTYNSDYHASFNELVSKN